MGCFATAGSRSRRRTPHHVRGRLSGKAIRQGYPAVVAAIMASWFIALYFFIGSYDAPLTHMGALSGYVLNVMMSALYIPVLMKNYRTGTFSYAAAWFKGVGTLLISVFCFLHFSDGLLLTLCAVTAALDAAYLVAFTRLRVGEEHLTAATA